MGWRTMGADGYPAGLAANPTTAARIQRFDHIAIAVRSLGAAVPLFRDVFGGQFVMGGDDVPLGIRTAMFKLPATVKVELLEPLSEQSYLHRYIERHGEGFHHATIFVDDVEATIADLEAAGYEVVDTDLQEPHWRETFVRPSSGHGCLFQIVNSELGWLEPHPHCTVEDVVAGRWRWWRSQVWHVDHLPSGYRE
ncbi:VOC family protein [Candidatus Poriferisocius sp.]|uniref:VOC family protein n=1 Tax=Candidatus Poriferisocius sp. TaxID=3101276 RepID=UPI003B5AB3F1